MKLTLEPTVDQEQYHDCELYHTIVIIHPADDLTIEEVGGLMRNALLAWGYHPENVDELFRIEE